IAQPLQCQIDRFPFVGEVSFFRSQQVLVLSIASDTITSLLLSTSSASLSWTLCSVCRRLPGLLTSFLLVTSLLLLFSLLLSPLLLTTLLLSALLLTTLLFSSLLLVPLLLLLTALLLTIL